MNKEKVLCIICARAGSKRLKNKNSKNLFGKPLIYHTIKQAIASKIFDKVVFSTDSDKLSRMAVKFGAKSWFIRPRKLSNDKAAKISSLVAIAGFVNVPIIKFSVDWWASLHQPSSVKILSETTIHSSMLTPLLLMTAAFALFSALIFLMKYNTELIKIKNKGLDRL